LSKSLHSPEHLKLIDMITRHRRAAGYTQEYVSRAIGQHQSYIAKLETRQRRLDVVEYIAIAKVIGFDPAAEISTLAADFDLAKFRG
jgi:transcriptional regulator with XRE-family HTH domain